MGVLHRSLSLAAALAAFAAFLAAARADPVADFYRGKTVRVVIGFGEGGGYDLYGRLAAEFLGRHIPGHPSLVPVNMPGAGSFNAASYLALRAPRDGTILGILAQSLAMDAATDPRTGIDPTAMPYIGRLASSVGVGVALARTGITSFDEARRRALAAGVSGGGSTSTLYALALDAYAGARFKLVRGYSGSAEILLAAERGEIDIVAAVSLADLVAAHRGWLAGEGASILYQNALHRHRLLPGVPTLPELGLDPTGRAVLRLIAATSEIGRSILATPGVPAERLQALRAAFREMVADPDFRATCALRHIEIDPADGAALDALVRETAAMPQEIRERLRALLRG